MILTLEEIKSFLKLEEDFTEDDNLIKSLMIAAEEYIKNATGIAFDNTNQLAKLAVTLLVSHWYENRNIVIVGTISKELEFSLKTIMTQLTYCYIEDDTI